MAKSYGFKVFLAKKSTQKLQILQTFNAFTMYLVMKHKNVRRNFKYHALYYFYFCF